VFAAFAVVRAVLVLLFALRYALLLLVLDLFVSNAASGSNSKSKSISEEAMEPLLTFCNEWFFGGFRSESAFCGVICMLASS